MVFFKLGSKNIGVYKIFDVTKMCSKYAKIRTNIYAKGFSLKRF